MASGRDELNAHAVARRRTVAAFLRPSSGGDEQHAPRPLRAVVPGVVAAALAAAGFGGYGLVEPSAPPGWQRAEAVIVGEQSTTRYVVLDGVLHPVLNIASARLLLGAGATVLTVDDSVLDSGTVPHGPPVGLPYAPDTLPAAGDAGTPKAWAYCDRPAAGGRAGAVEQRLFVLGGADAGTVSGTGILDARHALYVRGPDRTPYLVDSSGTAHVLAADGGPDRSGRQQLLVPAVFGATWGEPQAVGAAWLATLRSGDPIGFPRADLPGWGGPAATVVAGAPTTVGETFGVRADDGQVLHYVVLRDGVRRTSAFTDRLLVAMSGRAEGVVPATAVPDANARPPFEGRKDWPLDSVTQTNSATSAPGALGGGAGVACAVYTGRTSASGAPVLGLWAGRSYPVGGRSGTAGVYVTPGTGLLYRQFAGTSTGTSTGTGPVDLLTDTGVRYPVQPNGDAQARLGYPGVVPVPVPLAWSSLLPSGPELSTAAASRSRGS